MSLKIGVFGGTQGVGKEFIRKALAAGHSVTALARSPEKLSDLVQENSSSLTVVQGDVLDSTAVGKVVADQDVIVSSLGGSADVCSKGTPVIIGAMKEHNVKRTLVVTSFGVNESYNDADFVTKGFLNVFLGKILADKAIQENLYKGEPSLEWTVIRPGRLLDDPGKGVYRHGLGISGGRIAREDVAHFLMAQLTSTEYLKKAPTVVY